MSQNTPEVPKLNEHGHTPEELKRMIEAMRALSSAFYSQAAKIGNHAFIEFNGLMNEYILLCGDALEKGIDFTECSTHTGKPLPMASYRAAYLAEKFDCIYGPALQEPGVQRVFVEKLWGPDLMRSYGERLTGDA